MLGAKVILTPAAERGSGMVKKVNCRALCRSNSYNLIHDGEAKELAKEHGWFLAHQFENQAGPDFHAQTTGAEIVSDFAGRDLDYWVTGYGTGGTLQGVGRVLKAARPDVKIVVSEPGTAAILSSFQDGVPQALSVLKKQILNCSHSPMIRPSRSLGTKP